MREDATELVFLVGLCRRARGLAAGRNELCDAFCQLPDGQNEIRRFRGDGGARHAWIFRLLWRLHEDDAAALADRLGAGGTVRAGAGEDYRKSAAILLGQRAEKEIDGGAM